MGYIYRITNLVNKKQYIGQTKNYISRWKCHIYKMKKNAGCPALTAAMLKHGEENFKFEVICICFDDDLDKIETEYIKRYNTLVPNGYNISTGGKATYGFLGKTHSEETRKVISQSVKERFADVNERVKASDRMKAVLAERGDEISKKISDSVLQSDKFKRAKELGIVGNSVNRPNGVRMHTEEEKKKISESVKRYFSEHSNKGTNHINIEKHRHSMAKAVGRAVLQYDLDGNFLGEYESFADAARKTGVSKQGIRFCAIGKFKQMCSYVFKLKEQ